jgi:hypothetical protein
MAQSNTATEVATPPKSDTVKVRVLHSLCRGFNKDKTGRAISEITHKPGDVLEMPREEAEALAGRKFEGYGTMRQENGGVTCAPMPHPLGGIVKDPVVQLIGE